MLLHLLLFPYLLLTPYQTVLFIRFASKMPFVGAFLPGHQWINTCHYVTKIRIDLLSTINNNNKKKHLRSFTISKQIPLPLSIMRQNNLDIAVVHIYIHIHTQGGGHRAQAITDFQTTTCLLAFIPMRVCGEHTLFCTGEPYMLKHVRAGTSRLFHKRLSHSSSLPDKQQEKKYHVLQLSRKTKGNRPAVCCFSPIWVTIMRLAGISTNQLHEELKVRLLRNLILGQTKMLSQSWRDRNMKNLRMYHLQNLVSEETPERLFRGNSKKDSSWKLRNLIIYTHPHLKTKVKMSRIILQLYLLRAGYQSIYQLWDCLIFKTL